MSMEIIFKLSKNRKKRVPADSVDLQRDPTTKRYLWIKINEKPIEGIDLTEIRDHYYNEIK